MRNPETILNNLVKSTDKKDYKFQRLYRNLFNKEFYIVAYTRLAHKGSNFTKGISDIAIDRFSLKRVDELIGQMRTEKYQPKSARLMHLLKSNGKRRRLGISNFNDKLVQEVIKMILEAIYEKTYSQNSHGFRPNRSCHTALVEIKCNFIDSRWFIKGDIHSFVNNMNHHILINLLRKKIEDERFLRLIWKFLRAGYAEEWVFHKTYSGCPQGGIISPVLSNIYLNELDMYVEEYKSKFDRGKEREKDSEYKNIYNKICTRQKKLTKLKINDEKYEEMLSEIKDLKKKMHEISEVNQIDKEYRRLYYTRYADDFIIGLIGSKEEAIKIKDDIEKFLKSKLDIVLSGEKRCITHSNKFVHFLGYNIAISRKNDGKKTFKSSKKKIRNLQCELYLSQDIWIKKLKELGIFRIKKDGTWIAKPRLYLMNLSDAEILNIYNNEIRGLYKYYKLAKNISVLKHFVYYMKYSLYMTLASKYNSSISRIIRKYSFQGTFRVSYRTNTEEKYLYLYNKKFKMDFRVNKNSKVDTIATNYQYYYSTKLTQRYYQTSLNSIKRQKEQ